MNNIETLESKKLFVDKFVKPMVIAMGIGATDVEYTYDIEEAHGWVSETVTVYYGKDRVPKEANVNSDSYKAIVNDMFLQGAIR